MGKDDWAWLTGSQRLVRNKPSTTAHDLKRGKILTRVGGRNDVVNPFSNGRITFTGALFETLAVLDCYFSAHIWIRSDFCKACAHNETDVLSRQAYATEILGSGERVVNPACPARARANGRDAPPRNE